MWFDTHVNLHHERFDEDRAEVVARAREAGISDMVEICQMSTEFEKVIGIAEEFGLWATIGTHPHHAKDDVELTVENLVRHAAHPRVVGIGETGLDFHYGFSDEPTQRANFAKHIAASQQTKLPLIIHSREADEMMDATLREAYAQDSFPMLLHCFTATPKLAECVLELGGYVSFSGIATFKNAHDVRAAVDLIPDDKLLIETDCPYLTPVPDRGRRCEPHHVARVGEMIAELRDWTAKQCATITTANAYRCFAKAKR
jgi:TatD DNase family protein